MAQGLLQSIRMAIASIQRRGEEGRHGMSENDLEVIDLTDAPWPLSLLKGNAAMERLPDGGRLLFRLTDRDVAANLIQIINAHPALAFRVEHRGDQCFLRVTRRPRAHSRDGRPDRWQSPDT
jgi:hypothetical protein